MPTFYKFFKKTSHGSQVFEKELVAFDLLLFPKKKYIEVTSVVT